LVGYYKLPSEKVLQVYELDPEYILKYEDFRSQSNGVPIGKPLPQFLKYDKSKIRFQTFMEKLQQIQKSFNP
jgi:hypothetical protein